jgi:hypothetical protein
MRSAHGDDDVFHLHIHVIFRAQLFRNGLAQRSDARRGRIPCLIFTQRAHHRLLDAIRRVKKRFAAMKGMHGNARGAQFQNLVANLHNVRKAYFVEPLRGTECTIACHGGSPGRKICTRGSGVIRQGRTRPRDLLG